MKKKITIFGSSGSIGESTLDIISNHADKYQIVGLVVNSNYRKLHEQVEIFKPSVVSIFNKEAYINFQKMNNNKNLVVLYGENSLLEILDYDTDIVVAAITGAIGLLPVVKATEMGKIIALANKESLVCSGSLINKIAKKTGSLILPIDSEHNAIHQVLDIHNRENISKLILF